MTHYLRTSLAACALVASVAAGAFAQTATVVGFIDTAPYAQDGVRFEVETTSNGIVPCDAPRPVGTDRYCDAAFSRTASQQIRIRGRITNCNDDNDAATPPIAECISGWSPFLTAPAVSAGSFPGPFTINQYGELATATKMLLVGNNTSTWVGSCDLTNGVARFNTAGYVAVASGQATEASMYLFDWAEQTTSRVKIVVFNAAGVKLGVSNPLVVPVARALVTATFPTPFPVVAGQTYYLAALPNAGTVGTGDDNTTFAGTDAGGSYSYANPSGATLAGAGSNIGRFAIWLDGAP